MARPTRTGHNYARDQIAVAAFLMAALLLGAVGSAGDKPATEAAGSTWKPLTSAPAESAPLTVEQARENLDFQMEQLRIFRELLKRGQATKEEVEDHEIKAAMAQSAMAEAAAPEGSAARAAARLAQAKGALTYEMLRLDRLRAALKSKTASQEEVAAQEMKVEQAQKRVAELDRAATSAPTSASKPTSQP